ncbi:MAG: hypothetical protein KF819_14525 [Labilithrix sp.]|nr:hypothetical protein [Labilithrix sp.]
MRRLIMAAVLAATLAGTSVAFGQSRADLEKARAAYLARNYAEAEERLRALVDPKTGVKELTLLSQGRMYLGAVLLAQGKREQAIDVFEKLILEDPPFEPDPLGYPTDVINTFIDVRVQLQERIRQAAQNAAKLEAERRARAEEEKRRQEEWLAKVKQMAEEEKITVRNSRLVAFLPFGAGQFQNGQPILGWAFLVTEAALVVGTAVTIPMFSYARGRAQEEARAGDIERKADIYQARADAIRVVNLSMAGAFGLIAAAGILQANLAYVPETFETKKRELPSASLRLSPVIAPTQAGVFFGVSGVTF